MHSINMRWIINHFQKYRRRKPWDFFWRITLEGLAVSVVIAVILYPLDLADREMPALSRTAWLFLGVIAAPLLETLLLQVFPIWVLRRFRVRFVYQVIVSTAIFSFLHLLEGIGTAIAAGLVGGFYFAFTYAHWREKSRWTAFWITSLSHASQNAIILVIGMATGEI